MSAPGRTKYFGGDALVRRAALEAVHGYNENLIAGEEPEMCRRMRAGGYRILQIDRPMTEHDLDMRHWQQYWRRSVRTGYAYAEISTMYARTFDPLWLAESRRNRKRALAWMLGPLAAVALGVVFASLLPLGLFALAAGLLVGRSALRVRKRAGSARITLIYGLHSHLQQVPIFFGQVRFFLMKRLRRPSTLIEYKAT